MKLDYKDIKPYHTILINGDTGWTIQVMAQYGPTNNDYLINTRFIVSVKEIYYLPEKVLTLGEMRNLNLSIYIPPLPKKKGVKEEEVKKESPWTMTRRKPPGEW